MDLIYTNSARVDQGVLQDYELDLAFGADENNLECKVQAGSHCCESGSLLYIEGTEYGGIIDSIESDTDSKEVIYTGRTWHGILNSKVIQPDSGEAYLVLNGEANAVIADLLSRLALTDLFEASSEDSGLNIRNYKMNRYISGYDGIRKMLGTVGGKLNLTFSDGKVGLAAEAVHDYTQDEEFDADQVPFRAKRNFKGVNHLICLGSGQLEERMVVHLYADKDGNISREQTQFGLDEVCTIYEYSNVETVEELTKEGMDKFESLMAEDEISIDFDADSDTYDVGDIIGAVDNITGLMAYATIAKKIVTIKNGQITVSLTPDTAKEGSSYEVGASISGGGGTPGTPGKDGEDGISCTHSWNGTVLTVTSASGTSSADLKGESGNDGYTPVKGVDYFDGKDGVDGSPGRDGYTPQKGIDYFDGEAGQPGENGADGISCTHSWDGTTLTVNSASGSSSANLKGEPGNPGKDGSDGYTPQKGIDYFDGKPGADGKDGYTPVKGVDYFDGATGSPGADGKDGVSCTHSWNGTTLSITSASGTSSANLKGDKGDKGDTGAKGDKGDTGAQGAKGDTGAAGTNATINGVNTLIIQAGSGISLSQNGNVLTIIASGSGFYPQIVVTAPTGSTVTCAKGDVVLIAEEVDGTWTFNITEFGEWTVNCSLGQKSKSISVLVDSVKQYAVKVDYVFYLYNEGDECEAITGGWTTNGYNVSTAAQKLSNSMYASSASLLGTNNAISFNGFTKLCIDRMQTDSRNLVQPHVNVNNVKTVGSGKITGTADYASPAVNTRTVTEIDITSLNGSYYVIFAHTNSNVNGSGYIYKIWLE